VFSRSVHQAVFDTYRSSRAFVDSGIARYAQTTRGINIPQSQLRLCSELTLRSFRGDNYTVAFSIALRIFSLSQNTPSPVCPLARVASSERAWVALISASAVLLANFNKLSDEPNPTLTSYTAMVVGLCIVIS